MVTKTVGQYGKISEYEKDNKDSICYIERIMVFFKWREHKQQIYEATYYCKL